MNWLKIFSVALFLCFFSFRAEAQTTPPPPEKDQILRIGSSEVMLDFVARDKKGNRVIDLKPEEIEIYEDGTKQTPTAFKLIQF